MKPDQSATTNQPSSSGLTEDLRKLSVQPRQAVVTKVLDQEDGEVMTMDFPLSFYERKATELNTKIKKNPGSDSDKNSYFIQEIKTFFAEAEAQISAEAVASIAKMLWKNVLKDTTFSGMAALWGSQPWKEGLKEMSAVLNVSDVEKERRAFYKIEGMMPGDHEELRLFCMRLRSEIVSLKEKVDYKCFPPAFVIAMKLREWTPLAYRSVLPVNVVNPTSSLSWNDLVSDLEKLSQSFPFGIRKFCKNSTTKPATPALGLLSGPGQNPTQPAVAKPVPKASAFAHPKAKPKVLGALNAGVTEEEEAVDEDLE